MNKTEIDILNALNYGSIAMTKLDGVSPADFFGSGISLGLQGLADVTSGHDGHEFSINSITEKGKEALREFQVGGNRLFGSSDATENIKKMTN